MLRFDCTGFRSDTCVQILAHQQKSFHLFLPSFEFAAYVPLGLQHPPVALTHELGGKPPFGSDSERNPGIARMDSMPQTLLARAAKNSAGPMFRDQDCLGLARRLLRPDVAHVIAGCPSLPK